MVRMLYMRQWMVSWAKWPLLKLGYLAVWKALLWRHHRKLLTMCLDYTNILDVYTGRSLNQVHIVYTARNIDQPSARKCEESDWSVIFWEIIRSVVKLEENYYENGLKYFQRKVNSVRLSRNSTIQHEKNMIHFLKYAAKFISFVFILINGYKYK